MIEGREQKVKREGEGAGMNGAKGRGKELREAKMRWTKECMWEELWWSNSNLPVQPAGLKHECPDVGGEEVLRRRLLLVHELEVEGLQPAWVPVPGEDADVLQNALRAPHVAQLALRAGGRDQSGPTANQ